MHRFFLSPDLCKGETIALDRSESHHAANVLRVNPGQTVEVLNGLGLRLICEISTVEKRAVSLRVSERIESPPPAFEAHLFQSVIKGKGMDFLVQKVTEIGITHIHPILTHHCVARPDKHDEDRIEKWRQTTIEAAKQCGRSFLPQISPIQNFQEAISLADKETPHLYGALKSETKKISEAIGCHTTLSNRAAIWIGPEGDFSEEEYEAFSNAKYLPVTLGPHVLRAETAAITGTALLVDALTSA